MKTKPNENETNQNNMKTKLFSHYHYDGGFWFRILGRGLSVEDKQKHRPRFGERGGYEKVYRFGKWGVKYLK